MAEFTRTAIKETFISLLEERPLNEITVKNIVEKCGVNRNTFYYHFQDISSLLDEVIREDADMIINQYPSVTSIVDCFDAMVQFTSHRKRAIMHIFRSISRETFEGELMKISEHFVQRYVDSSIDENMINDEERKVIIRYYKCVCFGLVIDWLNSGMSEDMAKDIRNVFFIKKNRLEEIASMLRDER
ncbi:MAG: TetR/AcrR family transcriptional regulator [Eubacteriaceae bacterium]|nr:TetR/AcrR family transcriptional regulator [Eubacteriaceae bacterium]